MPCYLIATTRRVVEVTATSPDHARAIFLGEVQSDEVKALGRFPDFDTDPDGWREHYRRFLEVRPNTLGWAHGECMTPRPPELAPEHDPARHRATWS